MKMRFTFLLIISPRSDVKMMFPLLSSRLFPTPSILSVSCSRLMSRKKFSPLRVFQDTPALNSARLPSFLPVFRKRRERSGRGWELPELGLTSSHVDENEFGTVGDQKTSQSFTSPIWEEFSRSARWERQPPGRTRWTLRTRNPLLLSVNFPPAKYAL